MVPVTLGAQTAPPTRSVVGAAGLHPGEYAGTHPQADGVADALRYRQQSMDRRDFLVDGAVAVAAFALSAAILAASGPDPDIRDPDVLALGLVAAHSASVVLRRPRPVAAVALALASGLAYAAAKYPPALLPVVLLTVYSAAARLPERPSRRPTTTVLRSS